MNKPSSPQDKKKKYAQALKYSSLVYELLILLLIGVALGQELDRRYALEEPYFTIGLTLTAVVIYIVRLVYQLNADNK